MLSPSNARLLGDTMQLVSEARARYRCATLSADLQLTELSERDLARDFVQRGLDARRGTRSVPRVHDAFADGLG